MSDTPETDMKQRLMYMDALECVEIDFARKLERERNRYKSDVEVIIKERDEAREALRSFVQKMRDQAAVFKREDLRDNSRWSIFNEGRAQALEKFAEDLEVAK